MIKPKITIIVPVYNAEQHLRRMLNSILSQSFMDFELFLINDGSTDSSGLILNEYKQKDNRIHVFCQKNSGPSVARNLGIEHARGEFLSFLDSDDVIDKDFYKSFFINGEDFDIFYQGYIREYPNRNISKLICPKQTIARGMDCIDVIFYLRKYELLGWAWIKLLRTSIVKKHGIRFNPLFRWREDSLFAMQFCEHICSISVVSQCHYHYYVYNDSLSRSMRDPIGLYMLGQEMWKASKYLFVHDEARSFEQKYYWSVLKRALFSCYKFGAKKEFKLHVIDSVKTFVKTHRGFELGFKYKLLNVYYTYLFLYCNKYIIDLILLMEEFFLFYKIR